MDSIVARDGYYSTLKYASNKLRDNKRFILSAAWKEDISLQYASSRLRSDKEVVLAAVSKNGVALKFASDALQNNNILFIFTPCVHYDSCPQQPKVLLYHSVKYH